jgi:hypothetical protein
VLHANGTLNADQPTLFQAAVFDRQARCKISDIMMVLTVHKYAVFSHPYFPFDEICLKKGNNKEYNVGSFLLIALSTCHLLPTTSTLSLESVSLKSPLRPLLFLTV